MAKQHCISQPCISEGPVHALVCGPIYTGQRKPDAISTKPAVKSHAHAGKASLYHRSGASSSCGGAEHQAWILTTPCAYRDSGIKANTTPQLVLQPTCELAKVMNNVAQVTPNAMHNLSTEAPDKSEQAGTTFFLGTAAHKSKANTCHGVIFTANANQTQQ